MAWVEVEVLMLVRKRSFVVRIGRALGAGVALA